MSSTTTTLQAESEPRDHWFFQKLEKLGDRMNAILVKETKQALKSRQFVATFMLLLLASWVISIFAVLILGDSINYGSSGQDLFQFYYFVLLVAITVIVPFGAYRSMLGEKDLNTYDLLSITSLSPRQIVWGKLLSALLQVFIYYSAIAPFIAFTSLLEGFDLPVVAFTLAFGFALSLAYTVTAIMLSTFADQRHWQGILSILLLIGLLSMLGASFGLTSELFRFGAPFDEPEFWIAVGSVLAIGLSYCWLFIQITTAQLTFASGNKSSGIRLTSCLQQFLGWGILIGMIAYFGSPPDGDLLLAITIATIMHWGVIGLIAVTEEDFLSRRLRKQLPKRPLFRLLFSIFLPGGARGMAYMTTNLLILVGFILGLYYTSFQGTRNAYGALIASLGLVCYLTIYLGLGSFFSRVLMKLSGEIRPIHARVLIVLAALAGCIAPIIAAAAEFISFRTSSLAWITNPFWMVPEMYDGDQLAETTTFLLGIAALVAVAINLKAMFSGIGEVLSVEVEDLPEVEPVQPFTATLEASGEASS